MINPMLTSGMAKAHREDLLREAYHERLATEALAARDPDHDTYRLPLVMRPLVTSAHAFLHVAGQAAPIERRQ